MRVAGGQKFKFGQRGDPPLHPHRQGPSPVPIAERREFAHGWQAKCGPPPGYARLTSNSRSQRPLSPFPSAIHPGPGDQEGGAVPPVLTRSGCEGRHQQLTARDTSSMFVERATRLGEQERGKPNGPSALGRYVRRWNGWVKGGLKDLCAGEAVLPSSAHPEPRQTD